MTAPDGEAEVEYVTTGYIRHRHVDPEWLRERYLACDATMVEIAREAGVSVQVLNRLRKEYGITRLGNERTKGAERRSWTGVLTAAYLDEVYADGGLSVYDIAEDLGCAPSTVQRALKRHGIPMRGRKGSPSGPRVPVTLRPGETYAEAGERVGLTEAGVLAQMQAAGVDGNERRRRMTSAELAAVQARADAGEHLPTIADELGVPYRVLWNRLDRWRRRSHPENG